MRPNQLERLSSANLSIFAGKAKSLPFQAQAPVLLANMKRQKRSTLFCLFVSDEEKIIVSQGVSINHGDHRIYIEELSCTLKGHCMY
jgi:hypothetical protein